MKTLTHALLLSSLAMFSIQSHASCALSSIMGAPKLPSSEAALSVDEVKTLRSAVAGFLNKASDRLESCSDADPFVYNYAVDRLDDYARAFNQLAQRTNDQLLAAN